MQDFINVKAEVNQHFFSAGKYPNNNKLPVLIYKKVLQLPESNAALFIKDIFEKNNWKNFWTNGIYTYHHYHSNSHEVLGITKGTCMVMFGGDDGSLTNIGMGDVVIIPAGVAHKNYGASEDFKCVGAYPNGQDFDIKKGEPYERAEDEKRIQTVPLPQTDPVFGSSGPIVEHWLHTTSDATIKTTTQFY